MGDWFTDAFPLNLNQEEKEKKQNVIDSIDVANCIDVARPKTEKNRRRGHWTDKNNSYRSHHQSLGDPVVETREEAVCND